MEAHAAYAFVQIWEYNADAITPTPPRHTLLDVSLAQIVVNQSCHLCLNGQTFGDVNYVDVLGSLGSMLLLCVMIRMLFRRPLQHNPSRIHRKCANITNLLFFFTAGLCSGFLAHN